MLKTHDTYRDALMAVARLAEEAVNGAAPVSPDIGQVAEAPSCIPRALPARLQEKAAQTAVKINAQNAPMFAAYSGAAADLPIEPMHLTLLTAKYWGSAPRQLTVNFMEATPNDLRARILSHMNAWSQWIGVSFVLTGGQANVRISRGQGGYWSYLGTDIRLVPPGQQTMNLQGFTMSTPESEYKRVVRHETGHTLGFPHEHMRRELIARIVPARAYDYFLRTQGWSRQMVDQQVLTPLDQRTIIGTPADQTSIMCYQLPGQITTDGWPIVGGLDINATDAAFAASIYPRPAHDLMPEAPPMATSDTAGGDDWPEEDDVELALGE